MIQQVISFDQIPVTLNTLVVLDIDETIMAFPKINKTWWRETREKHFNSSNDKSVADNLTNEEWRKYVEVNKPFLLDEKKLKIFLEEIETKSCQLVLLTARDPIMTEITNLHLSHCELAITPDQVIHDKNKGEALACIVRTYPEISKIIFVDDFEKNLLNVQARFEQDDMKNFELKLYQINHD
jgi:hypothetical protein